nr:Chain I, deamidated Gliadin-alpha1 peptide [Triticum aestivum]4OZI_J Chain J, deamidated Gliadin-alpha1 peptide [Triticum aestivum]
QPFPQPELPYPGS